MESKLFTVTDRTINIPVIATRLALTRPPHTEEEMLIYKCGYPVNIPTTHCILLTGLAGGRMAYNDPWAWRDRTMHVAHMHICLHWDSLKSGDIVDVPTCLGELSVQEVVDPR